MDNVNTLGDNNYKIQLFGLITVVLNCSDKFSTRDVEIAFRIYNDKITNDLDINDPTIYGTGADREIPKKSIRQSYQNPSQDTVVREEKRC